jgi:hypothetical protein
MCFFKRSGGESGILKAGQFTFHLPHLPLGKSWKSHKTGVVSVVGK